MARTRLAVRRALSCVPLACLVAVLAAAGVAAAQPCDAGDDPACAPPGHGEHAGGGADEVDTAEGREDPAPEDTEDTEDEAAVAVSLTVSPVLDLGDLVRDPETGLATLTFTPTGPGEQLAVHDYTVANTGTVSLSEVTLVTDGTGTAAQVGALSPGEHRVVRVGRTFTFEQVAGGLSGIVDQGASVTGHADGHTAATAAGSSPLQLVAVLASHRLGLVKEVVVGAGDVTTGTDGAPTVTWSARAAAAGAARSVHYRLTITNLGTTQLHELDVVDPMLDAEPLPVDVGGGLAPGASVVLEVEHLLTPSSVLPVGTSDRWVEEDLRNVAVARGRDEAGAVVAEASAEAVLRIRAAPAAVVDEVLPAAGLVTGPVPFAVGLLLTSLGVVALRGSRPQRPAVSAAGERR